MTASENQEFSHTLDKLRMRQSSTPPDSRIATRAFDPVTVHRTLLSDGFVKLSGCIPAHDVTVMQAESQRLLDCDPQQWNNYVPYAKSGRWGPLLLGEEGRNTNLLDFLGESQQLDELVNDLLGRPELKKLLTQVLGRGYRIWYAQIRRAELNAKPVRMHQDIPGEVGLGILLGQIDCASGTTVFVKGSHRWPRLFNTCPFLSPRSIKRFLTPVVGAPGDCYLFYNCTLHGAASATVEPRTAIIFTFLPESKHREQRRPPDELLDRLGPHLRSALVGPNSNSIDDVDDAANEPDEIVAERQKVSLLSPWRIAMLAASVCDGAVTVYRRIRSSRRSS